MMDKGRTDKEKERLLDQLMAASTYARYLREQLNWCRKPYKKHLLAMVPMALAVIVLILVQAFCNVNSSVLSSIATALFMGLSWCAATVWERTRSRKGGNRHDH
jgi:predicted exporter